MRRSIRVSTNGPSSTDARVSDLATLAGRVDRVATDAGVLSPHPDVQPELHTNPRNDSENTDPQLTSLVGASRRQPTFPGKTQIVRRIWARPRESRFGNQFESGSGIAIASALSVGVGLRGAEISESRSPLSEDLSGPFSGPCPIDICGLMKIGPCVGHSYVRTSL
jgi:hypothetical protein